MKASAICFTAFMALTLALQPLARADTGSAEHSRWAELGGQPPAGLCVQIGGSNELTEHLAASPRLLLHRLEPDADRVSQLRERFQAGRKRAFVLIEHWTRPFLPHAENSVNLLLAADLRDIPQSEIERVLVPGGVALIGTGEGQRRIEKPRPDGMGEWTHQWSSAHGGLLSEDRTVGIPQGVQWLTGPLFAMAGRKSSTQSLVSAGGRNFYVTQNVLENVGQSKMDQYLVARDAYNGMIHWMRPWEGPFVKGSGETNPRMVASAHTLYAVGPEGLLAINTADGEIRKSVPLESSPDKLVLAGSLLLAQSPQGVIAFDPDLDRVQWEFSGKTTHGTVVNGERVLLVVSSRDKDGDHRHELTCLDLNSGELRWQADTRPHVSARQVRINFAEDDVVAMQAHGSLHLFAVDSGEHLWSKKTEARPGKGYVDERFVGHFYRQGLVWMLLENSPRKRDGQSHWVGLDPRTGKQRETLATQGEWPRTAAPAKMGCQLMVALDDYIAIPRQATFVDFRTGEKHPFKFLRGGCGLGLVPANGLVYSHPHACGCFSEAIRGFIAAHSENPPAIDPKEAPQRLETGPAFGRQSPVTARPEDWPMHRYGTERGAASPVRLDESLSPVWSVRIVPDRETPADREWELRTGAPLTAPAILGDRVYVADLNQGRIIALDRQTGQEQWSFTANGRINSPPTISGGLCLFGAHDGYVYALDAEDGGLAWRFLAAPVDQRIMAFGSLESRWPVSGTVLVQNGTAYVAAGRAPDADGGIHVHALDPATGKLHWSAQVADEEFFGLCDYLIGDGKDAFLSNWRFRPDGRSAPAKESDHLRGGKVGLLEASWTKHELASRKQMQTWTAGKSSGQILAFSGKEAVAYDGESRTISFRGKSKWSREIPSPAQVTALALTSRHVVAAGGTDRSRDDAGGTLWLLDRETGKIRHEQPLPSAAAFDGLAVAHGQVFVSTSDGHLRCFGEQTQSPP
jgi:outer membrane protein assembly factor BamB